MRILGIESTAHTAGIGVWDTEKGVLLNAFDSVALPFKPSEAAEHHARVFPKLVARALEFKPEAIAYAEGPGMEVCLRVGASLAGFLADRLGIPLRGVHHGIGHMMIARALLRPERPLYIYVSGVHTALIFKNKVVGRSLDTGMGNLFDAFARHCGFSSAPALFDWAYKEKRFVQLPWTLKGMDFSFSGLLTAARRIEDKRAAAYSLFETAFAELVEATERATVLFRPQEVIGVGGVFQNSRLQEMMHAMADEHGVQFLVPPAEFLRDNGAMIASAFSTGRPGLRVRRNYPLEEAVRRMPRF